MKIKTHRINTIIKNCTNLKKKTLYFWCKQVIERSLFVAACGWCITDKYAFFVSENTGKYKAKQKVILTGTLCSIKTIYKFTIRPSLFPSRGVRMQVLSFKCKTDHTDFVKCIYLLRSNLMKWKWGKGNKQLKLGDIGIFSARKSKVSDKR